MDGDWVYAASINSSKIALQLRAFLEEKLVAKSGPEIILPQITFVIIFQLYHKSLKLFPKLEGKEKTEQFLLS